MKKITKIFLFFLSITCFVCEISAVQGQSDNFLYKDIPKDLIPVPGKEINLFAQKYQGAAIDAYDLTDCLPENYVTDGSADYTKEIQAAINKHQNVVFPDFSVLVGPRGLFLKSNTTVIFREKSKLIMKPNNKESYAVLRLYDIENIVVYSPVIEGDRNKHLGSSGQWGMGISIRGARNVTIVNPQVSYCWGDGIYIGRLNNKCNENIAVYGGVLDYNRRNGISIVCCDTFKLVNTLVSNTYGNSPMSGIDVEPNDNRDIVDNIEIVNAVTFNNAGRGILIYLKKLEQNISRNVDISIVEPQDYYSVVGLEFQSGKLDAKDTRPPIQGKVNVTNPRWVENSKNGFHNYSPGNQVTLELKNVSVLKRNFLGREVMDRKAIDELKNLLRNNKSINID